MRDIEAILQHSPSAGDCLAERGTGAQIVSKRVIAAISQNASDPVYYFAGYHDQGDKSECRWTLSRDHARWFDADEAELEALLLTPDYVDYRLLPEPLTG